ncbi:MAG: trypsin-like peptidase domain-containing protein, partial [Desulfuromonadales bacterium]|nr:trypsin-like peptidase domain-containing protein [Desulfuromonadales bacterium]
MDRSILRISSKSKNVIGTGFVVDRDNEGVFVATCGHVVNDCGEKVLVEGKESSLIKNNYSDGLDLAILYVLGLSNEPLPILENKTAEVSKVIGYSTLLDDPKRESINEVPVKTNVQITKTPSFKLDSIKLYPGEPISRGYSGSPVICNKTNKVIGIVNIQVGDDTNYAICAKHLIDIYDVKHIGENNSFPSISTKKPLTTEVSHDDYIIIKKKFEDNLEMALKSFSTQQKVWIEPTLHSKEEGANPKNDKHTNVNLSDIVDKPRSIVVSARQQFGLTCLAHHLVKEAWLRDKPSFWLYLDANDLKPHKSDIKKRIAKNLKKASLSIEDIECIVLDEFSSTIKDASKVLSELSDYCADIPTIVMMTILDNPMLNESADLPAEREFELLHLWALPRHDVRQVVNVCNSEKYVGDENTVVSKVISDLEVLNIPRTPLNCLTILKIYEAEFDDSPVNRTEMIGRVLFLLFNVDEIPHYKSRPDLKDTEYILGHFCEKLIKTNAYYFSREGFVEELN